MGYFFLALIFVVLVVLLVRDSKEKKRTSLTEQYPDIKTQEDVKRIVAQRAAQAFAELGWDEWDPSVHSATGQDERIYKAATSKSMKLVSCDTSKREADVRGESGKTYHVSGKGCTCGDFINRRLPCKHMYFAMMEMGEDTEE